MSKSKILFQLTGSIACFKACQLISKLVQNNYEVQTVASQSALQFIGQATLEGLTGKPVYTNLWENGQMMDHIHLNRWADLIITAPATANYLNKIANGTGDDLLSTLFLAHDFKKPFLIAPAMNTTMYQHPMTQKSIQTLKQLGLDILSTDNGSLACGEVGEGRMLDPEVIFQKIESTLRSENKSLNILITSGGTSEPIDNVRLITNTSTGETGSILADYFSEKGYAVTYVHSHSATQPKNNCKKIAFKTFNDVEVILKNELKNKYDIIIHAAAVSDYSVEKFDGKMNSDQENVVLHLHKNKKIVNELRNWSLNKNIQVIAFKMTSTQDPGQKQNAIQKLFKNANADFVIHNDTHEMNKISHKFYVHNKNSQLSVAENKYELAKHIEKNLKEINL